jgi:hypothetical protein
MTATKTVKTTSNANGNKALKSLTSALNARIESANNDNQAKNVKAELKHYTLAIIESAIEKEVDLLALAKQIAISDKKDTNFLAVYAMQKVRKLLVSSAQNLRSSLDGYSETIMSNMTLSEQSNKSAYVSLSRSIEYNEFDTQKAIKARHNCNASTASTQTSSTRQALKALNIANVTKNKTNDVFQYNDSKMSLQFQTMLAFTKGKQA